MTKRKYTIESNRYIAVDFDGTITEEDGLFPNIGKFKFLAITTMKRMLEEGYKISIWTARGGEEQEKLIMDALLLAGLDTSKILFNSHFEYFLSKYEARSPKIYADIYIDDRAYGVEEINWGKIHFDFFGELNREAKNEIKNFNALKIPMR